MSQHVFSVLVRNTTGALARIAGLFSRRGFNIETITAGTTDDPSIMRLTIVIISNDETAALIMKQLSKLIDVIKVKQYRRENSVCRELMLVKVAADSMARQEIIDASSAFHANVVDISPGAITIEICGESDKLDAFINLMRTYGILESSRTGITAMELSDKSIYQ